MFPTLRKKLALKDSMWEALGAIHRSLLYKWRDLRTPSMMIHKGSKVQLSWKVADPVGVYIRDSPNSYVKKYLCRVWWDFCSVQKQLFSWGKDLHSLIYRSLICSILTCMNNMLDDFIKVRSFLLTLLISFSPFITSLMTHSRTVSWFWL